MSRPSVAYQRTYVTLAAADLRRTYIRDTIVVDDTGAGTADVPLLLPKIGTAYAPVGLRTTIVKPSDATHAVAITPAALDAVSSGTPGAFPDFGAAGAANASALPSGAPGSVTLEATDMALTGSAQPNPTGGTPTTAGAWLAIASGAAGGSITPSVTMIASKVVTQVGPPENGAMTYYDGGPVGTGLFEVTTTSAVNGGAGLTMPDGEDELEGIRSVQIVTGTMGSFNVFGGDDASFNVQNGNINLQSSLLRINGVYYRGSGLFSDLAGVTSPSLGDHFYVTNGQRISAVYPTLEGSPGKGVMAVYDGTNWCIAGTVIHVTA